MGKCVHQKQRLRAINWFNNYNQTQKNKILASNATGELYSNINLLPLDKSPIDCNSWLAGFSDADAGFSITITTHKKNNKLEIEFKLFLELN